jgi:hypothetical protein
MNNILSKLKGVMTEEDLTKFENAIKDMINEKVDILVESKTKELEDKAEKFCTEEVEKRLVLEKENILKEYDGKLQKFENDITEKLDLFLESEITKNISDDMINKIAINETYRPIVEEITKIFEEKYVSLDVEGFGILKEAKEEIIKLEEEVANHMAEKMELVNESDKQKSLILFLEKTEGLNKDQKSKVMNLIEGKEYKEVKKTLSSVIDIVVEQEEVPSKSKMVSESLEVNETTVEETVKQIKKEITIESTASKLL